MTAGRRKRNTGISHCCTDCVPGAALVLCRPGNYEGGPQIIGAARRGR